jgi:hypothetical protein
LAASKRLRDIMSRASRGRRLLQVLAMSLIGPSRQIQCANSASAFSRRELPADGGAIDPNRTWTLDPASFGSVKAEDAARHPFVWPVRHHPPR